MLYIVTEDQGSRWLAYPEGHPEFGMPGKTRVEAVGRLVVAKARRLGIMVRPSTTNDTKDK